MNKKLLFLHIPKTAGTSVVRIIQKNYALGACRGLYVQESFEQDFVAAMADEEVKAIYGHFFYPDILDEYRNQLYIFTFLRHPVYREVSNYLHLKYSEAAEHRQWLTQWQNFGEYLKSKQALNHQTRMLSGMGPFADFKDNQAKAFEMAQANLVKMNQVGLSEKFATSVNQIGRELNWQFTKATKENVNKQWLEARYLTLRYRRQIEAVTAYDQRLYNWVYGRLMQQ